VRTGYARFVGPTLTLEVLVRIKYVSILVEDQESALEPPRPKGEEGRVMHRLSRLAVAALLALALAALTGAVAGCALVGNTSVQHWEPVASGRISGQRPVRLSMGTYRLGDRVRVAWVLSGPQNPPVTLTFRLEGVHTGNSYSASILQQKHPDVLERRDESGLSLRDVVPGEYRLYLSQRFRKAQGPGYDIKFTIYTLTSLRQ
jgi:hypothetical protein